MAERAGPVNKNKNNKNKNNNSSNNNDWQAAATATTTTALETCLRGVGSVAHLFYVLLSCLLLLLPAAVLILLLPLLVVAWLVALLLAQPGRLCAQPAYVCVCVCVGECILNVCMTRPAALLASLSLRLCAFVFLPSVFAPLYKYAIEKCVRPFALKTQQQQLQQQKQL